MSELSKEEIDAVQVRFGELRQQEYQFSQKIAELENERMEHDLVIGTISKMDGARKCYQLIGGVLVEKTISTTIPEVAFNRDQIISFIEQLQKAVAAKTTEINALQKRFGASAGSVSDRGDSEGAASSRGSSKGVLVG